MSRTCTFFFLSVFYLGFLLLSFVWSTPVHAQEKYIRWKNTGLANTTAYAVSDDGNFLVTTSSSGYYGLRVWDIGSQQIVHALAGNNLIHSVAVSPDGSIVSLSWSINDPAQELYDGGTIFVRFNTQEFTHDSSWPKLSVSSSTLPVIISSSGIAAVKYGKWYFFDIQTGKLLDSTTLYYTSMARFSPDGSLFVVGTDSQMVVYGMNPIQKKSSLLVNGDLTFSISPDNKTIAVASTSGVNVYDIAKGTLVKALTTMPSIKAVHYIENGQSLIVSSTNHVYRISANDGSVHNELTLGLDQDFLGYREQSHTVITINSSLLVGPRVVTLWDLFDSTIQGTIGSERNPIHSVAFSATGKTVAMSDGKGIVTLFDATNGKQIQTLPTNADTLSNDNIKFTPDGSHLTVATAHGIVEEWDVSSGSRLRRFTGPDTIIRAHTVRSDGKYLSAIYGNDSLVVWDYSSSNFSIGRGSISGSVFSNTGKYFTDGESVYSDRGALFGGVSVNYSGSYIAVSNDGYYLLNEPWYSSNPMVFGDLHTQRTTEITQEQNDYYSNGFKRGPAMISSDETFFLQSSDTTYRWGHTDLKLSKKFSNPHFYATSSAIDSGDSLLFVGSDDGTIFMLGLSDAGIPLASVRTPGQSGSFDITPNPASNIVTVHLNSSPDGTDGLELFDLCGRKLFDITGDQLRQEGSVYQLNVSSLASGMYMMKYRHGSALELSRLIIQR
jgi:hypothetical protein